MAHDDLVTVTIVTYNSGRFIKRCLESVLAQKYPNKEVIVIDNASDDGTVDILEQFEDRCQIVYNDENIGFAAAQNQAITSVVRRVGADSESGRAADGRFHPGAGGRGPHPSENRLGLRQAADHAGHVRHTGQAAGGLDRNLLYADAAPSGPRQPGGGQRALPALRIRVRRERRGCVVPPQDDRRRIDRRGVLRSRFLRLPRGRRRRLARPVARLALHLYAARAGLSRAQGAAGEPARAAAGDQHALGEEPVPDAHQEHERRSVPA